jgi:hypothetical protein
MAGTFENAPKRADFSQAQNQIVEACALRLDRHTYCADLSYVAIASCLLPELLSILCTAAAVQVCCIIHGERERKDIET